MAIIYMSEADSGTHLNLATPSGESRILKKIWQISLMDANLKSLCNDDTDFQTANIWALAD